MTAVSDNVLPNSPSAAETFGGRSKDVHGQKDMKEKEQEAKCPVTNTSSWNWTAPRKPTTGESACPAAQTTRLNQSNFIPEGLDQMSPEESNLGRRREISSIPNERDERWVYPSEQQFYNALLRKGHETEEKDIPTIVSIHNEMNERCWQEIRRWEKRMQGMTHCDCEPKLVRFQGRPQELTPKAWALYRLGISPKPFDRHDWTVDRCGQPVRYVIDYYQGPPSGTGEAVFHVDARPAVDDVSGALLRLRLYFQSLFEQAS